MITKAVLGGAEKNFLNAVRNNDVAAVRGYLASGGNPDVKDDFGNPALVKAVERGNIEIVKDLLESIAEIDATNRFGATALMKAAYNNRIEIVELLVLCGADVNAKDENGNTALHYAVDAGDIRIIDVLAHAGARMEEKNLKGATAAMHAIDVQQPEAANRLVEIATEQAAKKDLSIMHNWAISDNPMIRGYAAAGIKDVEDQVALAADNNQLVLISLATNPYLTVEARMALGIRGVPGVAEVLERNPQRNRWTARTDLIRYALEKELNKAKRD